MRRFRVSSCLADVIQQIHSFRASGVMSFQVASAFTWERRACSMSLESLWTVPEGSEGME
jgi:hypothetical protein